MEASSSLVAELLARPFPCLLHDPKRPLSVDGYDVHSSNYRGLRVLDGVIDFETGERDHGGIARAESVGELLERQ